MRHGSSDPATVGATSQGIGLFLRETGVFTVSGPSFPKGFFMETQSV